MYTISKMFGFKGGVEVEHRKNTNEIEALKMPVPPKVVIPMLQHLGASCQPLVKKGDAVKVGQKIGDSEAFVSSPVHSSVSGVVKDVRAVTHPGGVNTVAVEIETDGKQEVYEGIRPLEGVKGKELLSAIRESGIVGLGGAGFPTSIKLSPPPEKKIDVIILNGAECEPYITSDYREMIENPEGIVEGLRIFAEVLGVEKACIAVESNKPFAIEKLKSVCSKYDGIEVVTIKSRYPQGAEKQLIYTITKREVPSGGLPADVGVIVHNVNTASFVTSYVKTGMPLIKKRVTVDGSAVKRPSNVEVLIGTPLRDVFDFCEGFKEIPYKVIVGGPMMGVAQYSLEENVITKCTNAVLAFGRKEAFVPEEGPCIRCGRCVWACPMNLMPLNLSMAVSKGDFKAALDYNANDCIECGCCSYVCPAKRQIVQSIRLAKSELKKKAVSN